MEDPTMLSFVPGTIKSSRVHGERKGSSNDDFVRINSILKLALLESEFCKALFGRTALASDIFWSTIRTAGCYHLDSEEFGIKYIQSYVLLYHPASTIRTVGDALWHVLLLSEVQGIGGVEKGPSMGQHPVCGTTCLSLLSCSLNVSHHTAQHSATEHISFRHYVWFLPPPTPECQGFLKKEICGYIFV